jgi:restriction system protein
MPVPKYNELMLPLLKLLADNKEHLMSDLSAALTKEFKLSETDLREFLPSGKQAIFPNRMGWARTYLKKAGLVEAPRRGASKITPRGQEVLKSNPKVIDQKFLQQFPEFISFQTISKDESEDEKQGVIEVAHSDQTPQELLEYAYKRLGTELSRDLLQKVQASPPFFFEQLVVDLLINMGYGGNRKDAGEAFATSGDGGIDGTIKEDKLGLDVIYVQAKRWNADATVGRPEIQKFAGALQGVRAKKGVFITTSRFSKEAKEYAANIESKIILIDGVQLANHMIESNTGVSVVDTYQIKKVDTDYFQETDL